MKKMLIIILTIYGFITPFVTCSQIRLQKTIGESADENAYSVVLVNDGGYLLCGYTLSYGLSFSDFFVVRTGSDGDTLWTRLYGGPGEEICYAAQQTFDGGFILGGYTDSYGAGNWDVYLVKTDASGNVEWSRTYGGSGWETAGMIRQLPDSGYIIAGYTNSYGSGAYDAYLIRTDVQGDTLWTKTYGGGNWDWINVVEPTFDGNLALLGTTMSFGQGNMEAWLLKTDLNGDTLWTRTYGKSAADDAYALKQLPDSGFVLAGITNSSGAGGPDAFLIRTDQYGDTLWCKTYGGAGDDRAYGMDLTDDGKVLIVGLTQSFGGGLSDMYFLKTDLNGDTLFTKTFGGAQDDWGNQVIALPDGDIVISGINLSYGAGGNDFYFLITDTQGFSGGCAEYHTNTEISNAFFKVNTHAALMGSGAQVGNPAVSSSSHGAQDVLLCLQCDSVTAQFSFADSSSSVQFSDASTGASSWLWYFGDGDSSALQNPTHNYLMDSVYYVCLITSNNCSADTVCDSVRICTQPVADFSWIQDTALSVQFSDSSTGAQTWYWDFGDGDTSWQQNPYHIYASEGWYLICLYVTAGQCSDSICDSIYVLGTGTQMLHHNIEFEIYPNPNNGLFHLWVIAGKQGNAMIRIVQADGRMIRLLTFAVHKGKQNREISLPSLSPGLYIVECLLEGQIIQRKLIIR